MCFRYKFYQYPDRPAPLKELAYPQYKGNYTIGDTASGEQGLKDARVRKVTKKGKKACVSLVILHDKWRNSGKVLQTKTSSQQTVWSYFCWETDFKQQWKKNKEERVGRGLSNAMGQASNAMEQAWATFSTWCCDGILTVVYWLSNCHLSWFWPLLHVHGGSLGLKRWHFVKLNMLYQMHLLVNSPALCWWCILGFSANYCASFMLTVHVGLFTSC